MDWTESKAPDCRPGRVSGSAGFELSWQPNVGYAAARPAVEEPEVAAVPVLHHQCGDVETNAMATQAGARTKVVGERNQGGGKARAFVEYLYIIQ